MISLFDMTTFDNIYKEYYLILLILAIIFYYISNITHQKLLAIIIIIILSYFFYVYLNNLSEKKELDINNNKTSIIKDIKDYNEISTDNFYIRKYPKTIKYLIKNEKLMTIVTKLRFIRKFDKAKYSQIIVYMNSFMKIYVYMLSDRYDIEKYISNFIDIRYNILELLYSLVIIIPDKLNHTFGLDTYKEINKSIEEFLIYSREMITIIEKYGKIEKKLNYIQDNKYRSYNILEKNIMP